MIELVSDIGGGKTTFTRGLARGINSEDTVSSPTFTLSNVYTGPRLTMHHFDFYRLPEPGIMREELAEVLADDTNVTVVEWAGIVDDVLPKDRLTITITTTDESSRRYELCSPQSLSYLQEGIV